MLESLSIRQATLDDIDFVIEAIIESEKSSSNMISTCNIFAISEEEFRDILKDVLRQDIENYDYYLSGFLIGEFNGQYTGASGSWLEGAGGLSSGIIKSTVIFSYLKKEILPVIKNNFQIIKDLSISREAGALQIEYVYVREKFRGSGIFSQIVENNIKRNLKKYSFDKIQSVLFKANHRSYSAFSKFGYKVAYEKKSDNLEILNFFSSGSIILMEMDLKNIDHLKNNLV
ncbi:MAG: hypothetical protein ACYCVH_14900 [Ignavibacteriaceae bacterium]